MSSLTCFQLMALGAILTNSKNKYGNVMVTSMAGPVVVSAHHEMSFVFSNGGEVLLREWCVWFGQHMFSKKHLSVKPNAPFAKEPVSTSPPLEKTSSVFTTC